MVFAPYKIKTPSKKRPNLDSNRLPKVPRTKPDEMPLTKLVQGKQASDIEERFARALHKAGLDFIFQYRLQGLGYLPGAFKELDFIVNHGGGVAVEVDGQIGHSSSIQQGNDQAREMFLLPSLRRLGVSNIVRVKWWQLETQDLADKTVREQFA